MSEVNVVESIKNTVEKSKILARNGLRPERKICNQLIVISKIHQINKDGTIKTISCRSARDIVSEDDPYIRKYRLTTEWVKLDTAWIKDIGYLIIVNEGGDINPKIPSTEEVDLYLSRIVDISVGEKKSIRTQWDKAVDHNVDFEIRVTEHIQCNPLTTLYLRCRNDSTMISVMAISK